MPLFHIRNQHGQMLLQKELSLTQSRRNTAILKTDPRFIYHTRVFIESFCTGDPGAEETVKRYEAGLFPLKTPGNEADY